MSAVNATSGFDYSTLNAKASKAKDSAADMQQSFLKLLITQMQNQDPMNPMDNAQTTSQMAQINTVTGIQQLNTTMTQMMAGMAGSQSLQAVSVVGKDVMAPIKEISNYSGKDGFQLGVVLPTGHTGTKLSILDSAGNLVDTVDVGASQTGYTNVSWDGKLADGSNAPAGNYFVSASTELGGKTQQIDVFGWQKVDSVTFSSSGPKVQLASGKVIDFADIAQLR
ncbi:flagellar hook assembly protein FlgD [Jeongeupia naejangsanensis]|uniref:Basal-body rod modification protein FlgD n=1 Tax=Jeongeupia naejangsanensis TaxID=613195 RepID=A0ABS2BI23_9NEIS|nr:flagellar hook assembly protein FlgD [Jeongeupia naejangsanensis]MBM3115263.1 flagellar hook assembly protein FlgD [Jeongeupia naejangsanensis]